MYVCALVSSLVMSPSNLPPHRMSERAMSSSSSPGSSMPGLPSVAVLFLVWAFLFYLARLWSKVGKTDSWGSDGTVISLAMVSCNNNNYNNNNESCSRRAGLMFARTSTASVYDDHIVRHFDASSHACHRHSDAFVTAMECSGGIAGNGEHCKYSCAMVIQTDVVSVHSLDHRRGRGPRQRF